MQVEQIVQRIQRSLDEQTKTFKPEEIGWFKHRFESIMLSQFFDEKLEDLKMSFVVDANVIVSSILRHVKGEGSILMKLAGNPLFELLAPAELEREVAEAIEEKAAKEGIRKAKLLKAWQKIKRSIKVSEVRSRRALEMARRLMGRRDPKDVPYVAMFVEMEASGVLTYDDDYEESPDIKRFNIDQLNEAVASFHRGLFMFVMFADVGTPMLGAFGELCLQFIKTLLNWLVMLMQIAATAISKGIHGLFSLFSRIPSGIQQMVLWGLLFGAIGVGAWLYFDKDARGKAKEKIGAVWSRIKSEIKKIISWISGALGVFMKHVKVIAHYTALGATVVLMLSKDMETILEAVRRETAKSSFS